MPVGRWGFVLFNEKVIVWENMHSNPIKPENKPIKF